MMFKTFELPHKPLMVDASIENEDELKIVFASRIGEWFEEESFANVSCGCLLGRSCPCRLWLCFVALSLGLFYGVWFRLGAGRARGVQGSKRSKKKKERIGVVDREASDSDRQRYKAGRKVGANERKAGKE